MGAGEGVICLLPVSSTTWDALSLGISITQLFVAIPKCWHILTFEGRFSLLPDLEAEGPVVLL